MFYNWRKLDGYNAPITVVVGQRGIGKTFGKVLHVLKQFIDHGTRFVYVVETLEDVKTLSQNQGERFFASIEEYLRTSPSSRSQKYYNALFCGTTKVEEGETDLEEKGRHKVMGGTFKINGETAGYLVAINSFGNLKRNNFVNIGTVIIDEFIPEDIDIRHLKIAYRVSSLIQTIARRNNVKIYMLGNAVRVDDILLCKLKIDNMKKGEIRVIKDTFGPLLVAHYVDPSEYAVFTHASEQSVAGRLSTLLGEDNLERNEFKGELGADMLIPSSPKRSHLLFCLHGQTESIRINVTKDRSELYVMTDYGTNADNRITFDEKFISGVVKYRPEWRDILINRYSQGLVKFESSVMHMIFKNLLKLDPNCLT